VHLNRIGSVMVFLFQNFCFALGFVTLWLGSASIPQPACAPRDGFEERRMTNARAAAQ
jgi:hypothetical protein